MGIGSIAKLAWNYGKRFLKVTPDLVLGNGAEVAGKALRNSRGSIFDIAKQTGKAVESLSVKNGVKIPFWKRITSQVGRIGTLTQAGIKAGAKKGFFGSVAGGIKGFFRGLGKNMPMLAAIPTILFELPNVIKATSEEGIGQGAAEIFKTGARLTGGAVCAAIGSAICPGFGSVAGWMLGDWLTSKIVGKSYSEQVAEAEMAQQEQQQQQAVTFDPNAIDPAGQTGYVTNPNGSFNVPYPNAGLEYQYNSANNPYANDIFYNQIDFSAMA